MASLVVINFILISPLKFPAPNQVASNKGEFTLNEKQGKKGLQTVLLLIYGYTSMAVMIWFTQWISLYGRKHLDLGITQAQLLMSLYSLGSISGVLVLFLLLRTNLNKLNLMLILNLGAALALVAILMGNNAHVAQFASYLFGFCAAGGVMQTGLTVFMDLYPRHRGLITGSYYFFGSIASFTVPLLTGILSQQSIRLAFSGDLIVALLGLGIVGILRITTKRSRVYDRFN